MIKHTWQSQLFRVDWKAAAIANNYAAAEEREAMCNKHHYIAREHRLARQRQRNGAHVIQCNVYNSPQGACNCGKAKK